MIWLMALWSQGAAAGPIVLHKGDEDAVRSVVSEAASVAADTLAMTHYDSFRLSLTAKWSGAGALTPCSGAAVRMADLSEDIAAAEAHLLYVELDAANEVLGASQQKLVCLDAIADPSIVSRIGFLQGVISTAEGRENDAWKHFSWAARLQPSMAWDEQYPADGQSILRGAQSSLASTEPVNVDLLPSPSAVSQLYLNAAPVSVVDGSLSVSPGSNLLQLKTPDGVVGFELDIEPDSQPQAFLPQLMAPDGLSAMASEEGRTELQGVINRVYEAGTSVYVTHDEGIWRTTSGQDGWSTLREPATIVAGPASVGIPGTAWLGAGLTAGALGGTVYALLKAIDAGGRAQTASSNFSADAGEGYSEAVYGSEDGYAQSLSAHQAAEQQARTAQARWYVGAGVGAAMTATGLYLTVPMF